MQTECVSELDRVSTTLRGLCVTCVLASLQVGFSAEGRVLVLQLDMYSNAGNSLDLSTSIMDRALMHCDCTCAAGAVLCGSALMLASHQSATSCSSMHLVWGNAASMAEHASCSPNFSSS